MDKIGKLLHQLSTLNSDTLTNLYLVNYYRCSIIVVGTKHVVVLWLVSGSRKLVVTDSWVILCGLYTMDAVRQDDVTFQ